MPALKVVLFLSRRLFCTSLGGFMYLLCRLFFLPILEVVLYQSWRLVVPVLDGGRFPPILEVILNLPWRMLCTFTKGCLVYVL